MTEIDKSDLLETKFEIIEHVDKKADSIHKRIDDVDTKSSERASKLHERIDRMGYGDKHAFKRVDTSNPLVMLIILSIIVAILRSIGINVDIPNMMRDIQTTTQSKEVHPDATILDEKQEEAKNLPPSPPGDF